MLGWLYEVSAEIVGAIFGVTIAILFLAYQFRIRVTIALIVLGVAALLSGCSALKAVADACKEGACG